MYIPRPYHQFIPFGAILVGLYFGQNLKPTYDVMISVVYIETGALLAWSYLVIAGLMYQAYITNFNVKPVKPQEKPRDPVKQEPGFVPLVRQLKQSYTQAVPLQHLDKERNFSVTLIRMYEYDPKSVDLTEDKWVKTGKFKRRPFTRMLENWKAHGIIERENENLNATHIVVRWDAVRLIAQGNPLPPPPG